MKKIIVIVISITSLTNLKAQNSAQNIIAGNEGLHISGYAQIDFNLATRDGFIWWEFKRYWR